MDRPRLLRGLRIAWSVMCGILCVLLVVLWVRSYWWIDGMGGPVFGVFHYGMGSMPGTAGIGISKDLTTGWVFASQPADEWWLLVQEMDSLPYSSRVWGGFICESGTVAAPYWCLILLS